MNEATLQRIEELMEKVNQLLLARETDEFITTRAPASQLKIYPMLKDALRSIEEERKDAIYSCPRSNFMNYLPPPLNDSASTAVRKADYTLHGIQVALAQATRPVDYYVHRIIQDNPGITSDDPRFLFADTMRVLLSDIAATVTQGRLDNLHRGMYLPEKPQQLVESEVNPLMGQNKLNAPIAQKAPAKRARIRKPFCGRQQYSIQNSTSSYTALAQTTEAAIPDAAAERGLIRIKTGPPVGGRFAMFKQTWKKLTDNQWVRNIVEKGFKIPFRDPKPTSTDSRESRKRRRQCPKAAALWATAIDDASTSVQAEAQSRGPPNPDGKSSIIADKESNRESQDTISRILRQLLTETELSCRREKLQDGVSCLHMQTNQAKGLHDVSRSRRRIHAHSYTQFLQEVSALLLERASIPIQNASVWTVSQPAHFYQGAPPNTITSENTEHQNICIPGRNPNHWGVEKDMQEKYGPSIFQADRTGIQNKVREVDNNAISVNNPSWYDDVEMPGELYWESPSYVGCFAPGLSNAETTLGTQKQVLIIDEDMNINCDTHRARQTEPVVLESPIDSLEWPIMPATPLRDSCGLTILLRIVESFEGVNAHQRQRTISNIIRTPAPECCWSFGISLLRQYHHSSICKEVWWDDLPETARNCRRNMEPLHSDKHAPSGYIRSVCNKSSGCTEPTDRTDGMVYVRPSVLKNNGIIWTTRCRSVYIENKHESNKILQLVSGQQSRRIEELTEKVNQLLLARETVPAPITVPEPEDEFITTRAPASELKIYPMLKDALPSIEEDFFCIQLTEKKRKGAIHSCPRSSFMNYLPPLLNNSALTAVRKADSTLHGIQVALAQATRPVDYYVHRIIQDNPSITSDDPRFLFADTMGVLLSDIAATVTQGRLDNLHRGMDLPGNPQQLVESEVKPLMGQDKLDVLIAQKAPAKKVRIRKPFCGRQQYGTQNSTSSYTAPAQTTEATIPTPTGPPVGGRLAMFKQTWGSSRTTNRSGTLLRRVLESQERNERFDGEDNKDVNVQRAVALWATTIDNAPTSVQAEAQSRGPPDPDGGSSIIANKESNRGSQITRSRILQPTVRNSKEDRGTQTCSRLTETELSLSCLHMQTNQAKGLHDVSRSRRRIYAHPYTQLLQEVSALLLKRESIPIQSAPVWTVSQPAHFYQGAPPDTIMGENTEHQNICIPGRHPNYWGVKKDMQDKYGPSIFQADRTGIQNQVREVDNNAISVNNPFWYGDQFTEHEPQSSFLRDSGPPLRSDKTIESWPDDVKMPGEIYWESPSYVGCHTPGSSNAETTLGTQKQVLIIDEDMDINCDTHRTCQTEPVVLERPIGSLEWSIVPPGDPRTGTLYRCQRHRLGDSCGLTILLKCCWPFGISLLRQYHHSSICKEVWWDDLHETARNCRRNMEPLHSDEHAPSSHIRSVCNESSGCTEPTDRTDGMVYVRPSVLKNNGIIWANDDKHKANKILQLVSGQQSRRSELSDIQLVEVDQPLLLPPMEPGIPCSPESAPRASDDYFNHTSMENSNLVSGSTGIISCSATASTGNDGHTRPQKRKISAVEQQELVPHGMENQRRVLQAQGLSDTAINIIVSNK
ncbi:hypothetical protein BB561_004670 [Smittium simulii]|uniref:Uncharacterized protein n=1 Tax=Smittium simulii TaxID=133385 RepID=A0A2T9YEY8_9FUNG|nr:hypothetical protein BB561_004670 [Smittium simulii]